MGTYLEVHVGTYPGYYGSFNDLCVCVCVCEGERECVLLLSPCHLSQPGDVSRKPAVMLFATLKRLNRLSHLYSKNARDQIQEMKLNVDGLHLQLQNLRYEAAHLQKEITNCLEFRCVLLYYVTAVS